MLVYQRVNGGFPIATFDYRRVIWNNHVMPKPLSQNVLTVFTIFFFPWESVTQIKVVPAILPPESSNWIHVFGFVLGFGQIQASRFFSEIAGVTGVHVHPRGNSPAVMNLNGNTYTNWSHRQDHMKEVQEFAIIRMIYDNACMHLYVIYLIYT